MTGVLLGIGSPFSIQVQRDKGFGVDPRTKVTKRSFIGHVHRVDERDSGNIITPYDILGEGGH